MDIGNTNQPSVSMGDSSQNQSSPLEDQPTQSKKFIIILGIIVALFAFGVGGYFLGTSKNQTIPQSQQVSVSPTVVQPSPTNSPTAVENSTTVNWKTYTNKKYSYSLNYPYDWIVKEENSPVDSVTTKTLITSIDYAIGQPEMGGGYIPGAETGSRLEIIVSENPNFKSFNELKNFEETKSTEFPLNYFNSSKSINIDGIEAMEKVGGKPYKGIQDYVYSFKNGTIYKIYLTSSEDQQSLFNQIISSFKFVK